MMFLFGLLIGAGIVFLLMKHRQERAVEEAVRDSKAESFQLAGSLAAAQRRVAELAKALHEQRQAQTGYSPSPSQSYETNLAMPVQNPDALRQTRMIEREAPDMRTQILRSPEGADSHG